MIDSSDQECKHCGKVLVVKKNTTEVGGGSVSLDSWKQKSIPAWAMYLIAGICLFCIWIMYAQGCDRIEDAKDDSTEQKSEDFEEVPE